jgi:hypothetical protein
MEGEYLDTIDRLERRIEELMRGLDKLEPNTTPWLKLWKRINNLKHDLYDVQYQLNMAKGKIDFWC